MVLLRSQLELVAVVQGLRLHSAAAAVPVAQEPRAYLGRQLLVSAVAVVAVVEVTALALADQMAAVVVWVLQVLLFLNGDQYELRSHKRRNRARGECNFVGWRD
jgi:hypothetical protein